MIKIVTFQIICVTRDWWIKGRIGAENLLYKRIKIEEFLINDKKTTVIVRKNVRSLTSAERKAFVNALLAVKAQGRYGKYVLWHHRVMKPRVLSFEPYDSNYRNGAHRGPAFLPWHREFLLRLEADLRLIDPSVSIPYWDWTEDSANPTESVIWSDDFLGGDGVESDQWRVSTGPFAHIRGRWPVPDYYKEGLPGLGLKRRFGRDIQTLPTQDDLKLAMAEVFYDTPPYNQSPFTIGFRNRIEGFVTPRGDNRVKMPGSQLHNRVHIWVGGNMSLMTSPHDPVFFLHHCFIDKVWADWQASQKINNPEGSPHYAPLRDGPPGHNLNDKLRPWKKHKIRDVLDIESLGYIYEQPQLFAQESVVKPIRSPFWVE